VKEVIIEGTRGVLDLAKASQHPRFLFVSSGAVYGAQPPSITHVPEDFDGTPNTPYGEAKKLSEQDCQAAKGIELSVARCYAFVGPYLPLNTHFAAGNFVRNILQNETITLQGDGTPYRSYMYPTDLVHWLLTILLKAPAGEVYNVGSDHEIQLRDLAVELNGMREEIGLRPGKIQIMKEPDVAAPRNAYVPSTKKAQSAIKLQLKVPLREAFRKTLQWHKEV
jgi:dTDP-glucose 4,6-dehydratase